MRIAADREATKRWVRERIRLYARRVSAGPFPTQRGRIRRQPRVVWSHAEAQRLGASVGSACRSAAQCVAATDSVRGITVFHLDCSPCAHHKVFCRSVADDTAAHEVAHMRWRSLSHFSPLFQQRVDAMMAGARCGPPGTRLPECFR